VMCKIVGDPKRIEQEDFYDVEQRGRAVSQQALFHRRPQSSQSWEYFKNSLLCALSASAVSSLLDRYNHSSCLKICASCENFQLY
jgi:hypothetical protein